MCVRVRLHQRMVVRILTTIIVLTVSQNYLYAHMDHQMEDIPMEYAEKHMPKSWWTDPKIIEEGRAIYQGEKYGNNVSKSKRVNCAKCHGADGKPLVKRTLNLGDTNLINRLSDRYLFWRVSEGNPKTIMRGRKERLTEVERWKVIAYFHTFSHGDKAEVHDHHN